MMRPPVISPRRLAALCVKEARQIVRDPSSIVIAFILPLLLMCIFGYGVNLDSGALRLGVALEDQSPEARRLAAMFAASTYVDAKVSPRRQDLVELMQAGRLRGIVVVPGDFTRRLLQKGAEAPLQVITDGSEPNTANFVHGYVTAIWQLWQAEFAQNSGLAQGEAGALFDVQARFWFNQAAVSRNFIMPGAITLILTVVGSILTSLVIAREWERGTMEALLSTRITRGELLLAKFIPYFIIGMFTQVFCLLFSVVVFGVPFRGSFLIFLLVGGLFMSTALGTGLLVSTLMRNQFNAAQVTLLGAFLPAVMLSGFIFEIDSMPALVRGITYILPARYYVNAMHTMCLAGNVPAVLLVNGLFLLGMTLMFFFLTALKTRLRLD